MAYQHEHKISSLIKKNKQTSFTVIFIHVPNPLKQLWKRYRRYSFTIRYIKFVFTTESKFLIQAMLTNILHLSEVFQFINADCHEKCLLTKQI